MNENITSAAAATPKHTRSGHFFSPLILGAIIALLFALWQFWTPVQLDDLWMQAYYRQFAARYGSGSFRAWLEYASWFRVDSNGRLANYLAPLVTLFVPRALFAAITGIFVGALYMLVARLSGFGRRYNPTFQWRWMALVWAASLVVFPWRDHIMLHDYALNYVYTTVIALLFVWGWLTCTKRPPGIVAFLGVCVVALLTGMMHEGFALPLLCGCAVVVLMRRFRLPWQAWVILALFCFASMESILSPGIFQRAATYSGWDFLTAVKNFVKCCFMLPVLGAVAGGLWLRRRNRSELREILLSPAFLFCVAVACVGAAVCVSMKIATPRFGWTTQVFCVIALGMIFRPSGFLRRRFWGGIALLGGVLVAAMMLRVVNMQKQVYHEDAEIRAALENSPTGTVFRDVYFPDRMTRLALLDLVEYGNWRGAFQIGCTNLLYPDRELAVIPEAFADFTGDADAEYPGDVGLCGYKGHYFARALDDNVFDERNGMMGAVWVDAVNSAGDTVTLWMEARPFRDRNGNRWYYFRYGKDLSDYHTFNFGEPGI